MANYTAPTITKLGSVHEQTLTTFYKTTGSGDLVILVNQPNNPQTIPGGTLGPS